MTINPEEHEREQEALTGPETEPGNSKRLYDALRKCTYWSHRCAPIPSERDRFDRDRKEILAALQAYENGPPTLIIKIEGGLVQTVQLDGETIGAEIHDYDTEGAQDNEVETDADDDEYILFHA